MRTLKLISRVIKQLLTMNEASRCLAAHYVERIYLHRGEV